MTDSFGTRLRRAREQQQISLADIAARTKIKASLFEEIERDDASHWPSGIFRRSFMRDYANAVGLDAEETVREFLRHFPDPADSGNDSVNHAAARRTASRSVPAQSPARAHAASANNGASGPNGTTVPSASRLSTPALQVAKHSASAQDSTSAQLQAAPQLPASSQTNGNGIPARHLTGVRSEPAVIAIASSSAGAQNGKTTAAAAGLRLTLVETGLPFSGGRLLADARRRWYAAAWDAGVLLVIATIAFMVTGAFWIPFAVAAVCYHVGGVLLLGNSPGVCLFAPRPAATGASSPSPARTPRTRHVETLAARHGEAAAFRARRWNAKRSELST